MYEIYVTLPSKLTYKMINILYIHGMGGGGDSRIPSILRDALSLRCMTSPPGPIDVVVRTYDFDPQIALSQISSWVEEVRPDLIVGESLGALHALRIRGVPKILVSPALNASLYFEALAWLTLVPGVTWLFDRIYRPKEGDRQKLHFTFRVLRKYRSHRKAALDAGGGDLSGEKIFAFFGTRDHYRRSGIVSVCTWKKHFGDAFELYDGTHFMEEEPVRELLVNKVLDILSISK